jgi:uncharacterized RDD family membrane protein YckC
MDNPLIYVLLLLTVVIVCILWGIRTRRAGRSKVDEEIIASRLARALAPERTAPEAAVPARRAPAYVWPAEPRLRAAESRRTLESDNRAIGPVRTGPPRLASRRRRLVNLVADSLIVGWLAAIMGNFVPDSWVESESTVWAVALVLPFILTFLYYFVFEIALRRTPGKLLTRTRVVAEDGLEPEVGTIAVRTLVRFVPFEVFSGLSGSCWHDRWAGTRVVNSVGDAPVLRWLVVGCLLITTITGPSSAQNEVDAIEARVAGQRSAGPAHEAAMVDLSALALAMGETAVRAGSTQTVPFCQPGQSPQFVLGFARLKAELGAVMGDPVECEHPDDATGDTHQTTTTGLAYWRRSTNTPTFTNGNRRWAVAPAGLIFWEGAALDPPAGARPLRRAAPAPPLRLPAVQARTLEAFVGAVSGHIDQYWSEGFARAKVAYVSPRAQWVPRGRAPSVACKSLTGASPSYCRRDQTLVFPATFFEPVWRRDADAAVAVVLAHEWAHHAQNSLGLLTEDYFTIQVELQADCFAGAFFNHANQRGWLDPGDLEEAFSMSWYAGDPESLPWFDPGAHGTPPQRTEAFGRGFRGFELCLDYTQ